MTLSINTCTYVKMASRKTISHNRTCYILIKGPNATHKRRTKVKGDNASNIKFLLTESKAFLKSAT